MLEFIGTCFDPDDGGYRYLSECNPVGQTCALFEAVRNYMTQDCANNPNCDIASTYGWPMNNWCVGAVKNGGDLFGGMKSFNEDISSWDVSSMEDFTGMFDRAESFNSDISGWDISNAQHATFMFFGATSFNVNLCAWNQTFPYNNAGNIFYESGCTYTSNPVEADGGPFCVSTCKDEK